MVGWGLACVGREVAGPARPQSDPPEMRSECVPQENKDSTEPRHSDVATDPINDLQFPVSQVKQSLVELTLALKDLHHRHTHSSTLSPTLINPLLLPASSAAEAVSSSVGWSCAALPVQQNLQRSSNGSIP